MIYRKATIEDIMALTDLRLEFLNEANGGNYESEKDLRESIKAYLLEHLPTDRFVAWLCIENMGIVGTSGIAFYELPPNYSNPSGKIGYIQNMYTKKPYRRRGIAKALFVKMMEEGKRNGVSKFVLHATKGGQELYKQFSFVFSNDEMHFTTKAEKQTAGDGRAKPEEHWQAGIA